MFYEIRSTPREVTCPCEGKIYTEREVKARAVLNGSTGSTGSVDSNWFILLHNCDKAVE
jgi:hypothetical protein